DERHDDLDRHLARLLLGALTPLDTHLPGLDVEHGRHRDAVLLGLDDGPDEPLEVVDLDPVGEILVGRPSRLPDLDVLERADQLLPERARGVASHVRQGSLEAETGLDRDGHLVEHVGQGELDASRRLIAWLYRRMSGRDQPSSVVASATTPVATPG